jgi:preprotein translocase subunit SecA
MNRQEIEQYLTEEGVEAYRRKRAAIGEEPMRELERILMLRVVDEKWTAHLDAMEDLKEGIYLRGYGQADPLVEYKREGYEMFEELVAAIQEDTVRWIMKVQVVMAEEPPAPVEEPPVLQLRPAPAPQAPPEPVPEPRPQPRVEPQPVLAGAVQAFGGSAEWPKVGRNDPCPCGSGKKYKKCHGRLE